MTPNEWLESINLLQAGGWAVAMVGGWVGVRKVLAAIRGYTATLEEMREDWFGVPGRPGVPGRDGVMERLCKVEQSVGSALKAAKAAAFNTKSNHGSSAYDAMMRKLEAIEASVIHMREWRDFLVGVLDKTHPEIPIPDYLDSESVRTARSAASPDITIPRPD